MQNQSIITIKKFKYTCTDIYLQALFLSVSDHLVSLSKMLHGKNCWGTEEGLVPVDKGFRLYSFDYGPVHSLSAWVSTPLLGNDPASSFLILCHPQL